MVTVNVPKTSCQQAIKVLVNRSATAVEHVEANTLKHESHYDLQCRAEQNGKRGVHIVRRTWADGSVTTHKIMK